MTLKIGSVSTSGQKCTVTNRGAEAVWLDDYKFRVNGKSFTFSYKRVWPGESADAEVPSDVWDTLSKGATLELRDAKLRVGIPNEPGDLLDSFPCPPPPPTWQGRWERRLAASKA